MDAKLEFEVDADMEGSEDMVDRGEGRDSWFWVGGSIRRRVISFAPSHADHHSPQPRATRRPPKCIPALWEFHVALRS